MPVPESSPRGDGTPGPVVTVTLSPALDVELVVDVLEPEAKLVAVEHRRDAGGGGVNVARVLHRLGTSVTAVIAAGGPIGDELVRRIGAEGLPVVPLQQRHVTRETVTIRERSTGRQFRVGVPGPPLDDPAEATRAVVAAVRTAPIVVLSGGLPAGTPADAYRRLVDRLPDAFTIVDASGDALHGVAEGRPSVIKPSRRELAALVGGHPSTPREIADAAHRVLTMGGVGAVLTSLGAAGAVLVRRDEPDVWYRAPAVELVSAVGAGDSLVAGIAAAVAAGDDIVDAVRRGVATGSATVLTPGTELCRPTDVERLLSEVEVIVGPDDADAALGADLDLGHYRAARR